MVKIISWNVNGIRANYKKGAFAEIMKENPDIICIQETKAEPDQLPDELRYVPTYFSNFSWSKIKKGYSGVAIYSKEKPIKVNSGIGMSGDDDEGRVLTAVFKNFVLVNCYFPNGGGGPDRLSYKLSFYDEFLKYINDLRKKFSSVIFCGDVNTAHTEIDLARPRENKKNTGFLPEERAWLDIVIENGWVDMFRNFYPNKKDSYTYWDMKTRARERNVGWRIDYFFSSQSMVPNIKSIINKESQYGSDHCPVILTLL